MSVPHPRVERFLRRIHRHQRQLSAIILQYDSAAQELRTWMWPVTQTGFRVSPEDLYEYRNDHQFRTPCCLCACDEGAETFTESAVYLAVGGDYHGEYVAGCARGRCGYLVCFERLYTRRGLLLQRYPVRPANNPRPPPILYLPSRGGEALAPGGLPAPRHLDGGPRFTSIPTFERPARAPETTLDKLLRLDSWARPGLTESEFRRLFAKCRCGLIMTRRIFKHHVCQVAAAAAIRLRASSSRPAPVVIDLTLEDDSNKLLEGQQYQPTIIDLTLDSDDL